MTEVRRAGFWVLGVLAVGALALGAGASCGVVEGLFQYCATRPERCACDGGSCCLQPGQACYAGQECCGTVCGQVGDGGHECLPTAVPDAGTCGCDESAACEGHLCDAGFCAVPPGRLGGHGFDPQDAGVCCTSDLDCASGACVNWTCVDERPHSRSCRCDDLTDCLEGRSCLATSYPRRCVPDVGCSAPTACQPNGALCGAGKSNCCGRCVQGVCRDECPQGSCNVDCCEGQCLDGGCDKGVPQGDFTNGASCRSDDQCKSRACERAVCSNPQSPGLPLSAPCNDAGACRSGLACPSSATGQRTCCVPEGGACVQDSSCCSARCLMGVCVPPPYCHGEFEPCVGPADCCSGLFCVDEMCKRRLQLPVVGPCVAISQDECLPLQQPDAGSCLLPGSTCFHSAPCCFSFRNRIPVTCDADAGCPFRASTQDFCPVEFVCPLG